MTEIQVAHTERGIGVVTPVGRLTMVVTRQLTEAITGLVDGGTSKVVVDLGETTFLDSSGLGALIAGLKRCRQAGGDLRLARPTEQVTTVLSLTNLDRVLRPRASVAEAF